MIKTVKGKLLLALGSTLVFFLIIFFYIGMQQVSCELPPCPTMFEVSLGDIFFIPLLLSVPLFIVIFLILHFISKYKK